MDKSFEKVLVCYSTNRDEKFTKRYEKEIIKSSGLSKKKDEIDVMFYFNDGRWSLTQVYNKLLKTVEGIDNILVLFIHHDIHFKTQGWGKNILNIFNNNEVDILGLAGTDTLFPHCVWWLNEKQVMNEENLWGKVWHTDGKKEWKSDFTRGKKCEKIQPVAAIDGVFIAVNPNTCIEFDETFDGFHFYDISFCIENHLYGKKIAITETIQIIHESGGQLSIAWEENRARLSHIYERELPIIIK